jgi:hypothetical protein
VIRHGWARTLVAACLPDTHHDDADAHADFSAIFSTTDLAANLTAGRQLVSFHVMGMRGVKRIWTSVWPHLTNFDYCSTYAVRHFWMSFHRRRAMK